MRQGVLVLSPSPWSKTSSICEEQRMIPWKREKFIVQSLEADEGIEPQASILYVSIGGGKLCKGSGHVSCLENIHRAPLNHSRITQVSWGFRGSILSILQILSHQNARTDIHPSAVPSHYCTERGRKGTSTFSIRGSKMEQASFYRMQKEGEVGWQEEKIPGKFPCHLV